MRRLAPPQSKQPLRAQKKQGQNPAFNPSREDVLLLLERDYKPPISHFCDTRTVLFRFRIQLGQNFTATGIQYLIRQGNAHLFAIGTQTSNFTANQL